MASPRIYGLFNRPPCVGVRCDLPSRTFQHFKDDCSIASMVIRLQRGDLSAIRRSISADVSEIPDDFQRLANAKISANRIWDELPEHLKAACGSVEKLVQAYDEFIATKSNKAESKDVSSRKGEESTSDAAPSNT